MDEWGRSQSISFYGQPEIEVILRSLMLLLFYSMYRSCEVYKKISQETFSYYKYFVLRMTGKLTVQPLLINCLHSYK